MSADSETPPPGGQFLVYQTQDGKLKIDVRFEGETVWLTQQHMAELFQTTKQNVGQHLKSIFAEGELVQDSVVKDSFTTAADGKNYPTRFYNLDAIISVGYRVKSAVATRFRIWATRQLREYIVKGFLLDDERLKNPDQPFDYFDELMRRIQDIRTSERRFYQKITDIYATSIDYDPTQEVSLLFFRTVQNKVHWAITGQTAAEIVHGRVDAAKPNLGLTNWRGAVIRKQDVSIAKNYLSKPGMKGYAVGFQGLVEFINGLVPSNEVIEQALRREVKMFPEIAVRELVANALIHQDFTESGTSTVIEIYDDRMEISNPGKPSISPDRFIDEYQSRNERLADLMRRLGICEEKGSGVDKVIEAVEAYQLPAPDFRAGERRTSVLLFAHREFEEMDKPDRIRATYQHCCLRYVMNERMTNQSLRERFRLSEKKAESVSRAIRDTIEAGMIKLADPEQKSLRYRHYLPFWA